MSDEERPNNKRKIEAVDPLPTQWLYRCKKCERWDIGEERACRNCPSREDSNFLVIKRIRTEGDLISALNLMEKHDFREDLVSATGYSDLDVSSVVDAIEKADNNHTLCNIDESLEKIDATIEKGLKKICDAIYSLEKTLSRQ